MDAAEARLSDVRLVEVVPSLNMGGLERIATHLILAFRRRSARVLMCSPPGGPYVEVLRNAGVEVAPIPPPLPRLIPFARSAVALARILIRERPDVLHAHNPAATAATAVARRLARLDRVPLVATYHGVVDGRVPGAARILDAAADLVVGVGPTATRELLRHGLSPSKSVTVLHSVAPMADRDPLDVRREFGVEGAELIVNVGRYVSQKNPLLLVDALRIVRERRPAVRALLVGSGPLELEIRNRLRQFGLENFAAVTGDRTDAASIIASADVIVLTSWKEGLPLVLLEAMSLRIPIVATDVSGVRDLVRDGETGVLVPPGNADALAAGIERVLADGELRARLTATAHAFVEQRFAEDRMLDRYELIYAEALNRRRRPPMRAIAT